MTETVFSTKDAMRLAALNGTMPSNDPKLAEGEWYHRHRPDQINFLDVNKYPKRTKKK